MRVAFDWALKNGHYLDEFIGKQKALGQENLNQTMRTDMWGVWGTVKKLS